MEYTDYFVGKGEAEEVRELIAAEAEKAIIVDGLVGFVPFVAIAPPKAFLSWDWLLSVYDAEGGAWGFQLYVDGKQIGVADYGENAEWGIDREDNGFRGNLDETAALLGADVARLEACFHDEGVEAFCDLHQYLLYPHENEMPDGVHLISEWA